MRAMRRAPLVLVDCDVPDPSRPARPSVTAAAIVSYLRLADDATACRLGDSEGPFSGWYPS